MDGTAALMTVGAMGILLSTVGPAQECVAGEGTLKPEGLAAATVGCHEAGEKDEGQPVARAPGSDL